MAGFCCATATTAAAAAAAAAYTHTALPVTASETAS